VRSNTKSRVRGALAYVTIRAEGERGAGDLTTGLITAAVRAMVSLERLLSKDGTDDNRDRTKQAQARAAKIHVGLAFKC
jgi:hypothetical protein